MLTVKTQQQVILLGDQTLPVPVMSKTRLALRKNSFEPATVTTQTCTCEGAWSERPLLVEFNTQANSDPYRTVCHVPETPCDSLTSHLSHSGAGTEPWA